MTTLLRAACSPSSARQRPDRYADSYSYEHDGGLLIENGIIAAIGPYSRDQRRKRRRMLPKSTIGRI